MPEDVKHCVACQTEFVAGIDHCSDCGGLLESGELPAQRTRSALDEQLAAALPDASEPQEVDPPDTLASTLPGEQAELVARALALEGVTSLLECEGEQKLRGPHEPPSPPIAVKRPVSIYVAQTHVETTLEIVRSLESDDVIGDQWLAEGEAVEGFADQSKPKLEDVVPASAATPLEAEGSGGLRLLIPFLIITAIVGLFLFAL